MVVKRGPGGPPRGGQVGFRHLSSRPDLRTTPLVVRESREWRDKIFAGKTERRNFGLKVSPFFKARLLLFAKDEIGVTIFLEKNVRKRKKNIILT